MDTQKLPSSEPSIDLFESEAAPCRHVDFIDGKRTVAGEELRRRRITPYRVTRFYRKQIRRSGCYAQLRRIVEPSMEELHSPGMWDTSGERDHTVVTGLQHKYRQTVLLLATDKCFCYCRFCFRKRLVGLKSEEIAVDYSQIASYIRRHPELRNVLISGGDPFLLDTPALQRILDYLLPIPHLRSIRFGTKALVFYPPRFRDNELGLLFERIRKANKTPVIVTHVDHFGEISEETQRHIAELTSYRVQLFNQTVLLREVNDDPQTLAQTFRALHRLGVRPYYLFQARPVKRASHFRVPLGRGVEIVRGVNRRLEGIVKTFRYVMSHATGKIEILDLGVDGRLYMRYHQSPDAGKIGRVFSRPYGEGASWLDELPEH